MSSQRVEYEHPSDTLYHNTVVGFVQAMDALIAACELEKRLIMPDEEGAEAFLADLDAHIDAARYASRVYSDVITACEHGVFMQLKRSRHTHVQRIAKAALRGDYNELAI